MNMVNLKYSDFVWQNVFPIPHRISGYELPLILGGLENFEWYIFRGLSFFEILGEGALSFRGEPVSLRGGGGPGTFGP